MAARPLALALALAAALALLTGEAAAREGFAVAPYLLQVTTDSATVAFHLREPMPAEVVVQLGDRRARFGSAASRSHFVRVTGLAPGRIFTYEVICGGGAVRTPAGDRSYQIRTATLPGESFTFAVYGDPRPGESQTHRHHRAVVQQILGVEPAFSLVLGDLVDDGRQRAQWEAFFALEARLRRQSAIYAVPGDNDYVEGRGRWAEYFPARDGLHYHFEWGGVHFFGMNAWGTLGAQPVVEFDARSEQLRWLARELQREEVRRAPFRVVFLHDPVVISRGRSSEIMRRVWGPVLARGGVDVVFASWHLYERSRHRGVTYVITGGAGAELVWLRRNPAFSSLAEARRHHFCRVDVKAGALQLRAIAEDGTILDSLSLFPRAARSGAAAGGLQRAARRLRRELAIGSPAGGPALTIHLFSSGCVYCRRLLEADLPRWSRQYDVPLHVHYYDLGRRGAYDLMMAAGADFGRQDADLPLLLVGRSVLGGKAEIEAGLPKELARFRRDARAYQQRALVPFKRERDTKAMRTERFEALNLGVVLAAGLLDGVNPCAFTTIIFLLSYLGLAGRTRRQLLVTGGLFTLAVFVTYLSIGVLFYKLVALVTGSKLTSTIINLALLALLLTFAALSARDTLRCLRGAPTEMSLKLPRFLSEGIRARIRAYATSGVAVGASALVLGVVIASMELVCTGQVYIPIVVMISEPRYRAAAALNLLAYNVAFIAPLLLVFLLASLGMTSQRLARFAGKHMALFKLGLTLVFVAMALMIVYNLGWLHLGW